MDISFCPAPALFYRNVTKAFPDLHEVSLVCGDKPDGHSLGQYQLSLGVPGNVVFLWGSSNLFFSAPYDFDCLCCFDTFDKVCLATSSHSPVISGDVIELNINNLLSSKLYPTAHFWNWTSMEPITEEKQMSIVFPSEYEEDLARVVAGVDRLVS